MKSITRVILVVSLVTVALPATRARADEEATQGALTASNSKRAHYGFGGRIRYAFMPTAVLNLFMDHANSVNSAAFGLEGVRRKGNFDIVLALEYESIAPSDGYFLENGGSAAGGDADYVVFDNFATLGLDATFVWHRAIAERVDFRYGGGIGVALVLGEMIQSDATCEQGTTIGDLDDIHTPKCTYGAGSASDDVPPVVPLVNALVGLRIQVNEQIYINADGGFRFPLFFMGVGTNYLF